LWATVVLVLADVVEVGTVVEVVGVVEAGEGLDAVEADGSVETVELVEAVGEVELDDVVRLVGPTAWARVVGVADDVGATVVPSAVLGGVLGGRAPPDELVEVLVGTVPDGASGMVVLVVDEVPVMVGPPVGAGEVVVVDDVEGDVEDDVEVVDSGVVDEVVALVVGPVVVVVEVEVEVEGEVEVEVEVEADGDAGTVVAVLRVVVVTPAVVVVVAPVVVVTEDSVNDGGGDKGGDGTVVSASAVTFGTTNVARARPVATTALPDIATSRASLVLELWQDKRIRGTHVRKSGRQSQLAVYR
jgi:hypothetical protein